MNTDEFIRLVKQIPYVSFVDIGIAINFADIYEKLTLYGWNKDSIEWQIEELERQKKVVVFRSGPVMYAIRFLL